MSKLTAFFLVWSCSFCYAGRIWLLLFLHVTKMHEQCNDSIPLVIRSVVTRDQYNYVDAQDRVIILQCGHLTIIPQAVPWK